MVSDGHCRLLPLDVAVRRVQLDVSGLMRLFRKEKRESTGTIGALLQRKGEMQLPGGSGQSGKESGKPSARPVTLRPPPLRPPAGTSGAAPVTQKENSGTPPKSSAAEDDGGTTSRLLAMKRKR